ncbi:TlpA disulfide reductase family protein [Pleionea sp. CnH1-48]|uniref:TlpA disulfide reductase family protein n=1 Tax=Pleionea sp. CnH1-48 TaxID=2954494 RepID=UPI00209723FE|nr:TlpA disulfide reductase family protein [Pleionea sp. CnH1-48]MCO7226594.1 TlpA family protein disulfide reductase [Pleionea sp. CnH1-48]
MRRLAQTVAIIGLLILSMPSKASDPQQQLSESLELHKGKVIYLDFWASWCVPCRYSFPWMNEMLERHQAKGFTVITVNLDTEKRLADEFLKQYPANFDIIYDQKGVLAEKYQLQGMPNAYVIDRQGQIVARHVGFRSKKVKEYEQSILTLLSK